MLLDAHKLAENLRQLEAAVRLFGASGELTNAISRASAIASKEARQTSCAHSTTRKETRAAHTLRHAVEYCLACGKTLSIQEVK